MIIKYDKHPVVQTLQERLAVYVRDLMDRRGLSTYNVADRSGGAVSNTTVWNVVNGTYKDVGVQTLKALARGLGVSERDLFEVVLDDKQRDKPKVDEDFRHTVFYDLYEAVKIANNRRRESTEDLARILIARIREESLTKSKGRRKS